MATAQPLKNKNDIQRVIDYFKNEDYRYSLIFRVGINTNLRIGDILQLKWECIFDDSGEFREYVDLVEKKTKKKRKIKLNELLREKIGGYCEYFSIVKGDFLFFSHTNIKNSVATKPITPRAVLTAFHRAGWKLQIQSFTPTSMRKTFAYHLYRKTGDLVLVMRLMNHSNPETTLRYICIDQDEFDETYDSFAL